MWASHQFKLNVREKDGATRRSHYEQVERQLGRKPKELEEPCDFPFLLQHVWVAFCALSNCRPSGFNGPDALTPTHIKDWMEITGNRLSHRDIDVIFKLDQTYLRDSND